MGVWRYAGGGRDRSYSVPLVLGFQHTVQEVPFRGSPAGIAPYESEIQELKEILKSQQEQLNQLARSLAALNSASKPYPASRNKAVICRWCQKVGHFARECPGKLPLPEPLSRGSGGGILGSESVLPDPLPPVIGRKPVTPAVKAITSVFPGYALSDLRMLQETDPMIREFLQFWRRMRGPDAKERGRTSRLALGLVRQWSR
ncbi:uncharacterized protein LOC112846735 [Oreochromis niloticus]|uniref:uncharacterized protein LOC112846735 n=1 Tax=Oreochromis niloticus TaxID=8128 RepID=UPI000DF360DB|nr:uncharacterized protein LOC112846735 [Oreochromis niloticus]CAI5682491.1 unnamed protein product [Mustela putorius furo]